MSWKLVDSAPKQIVMRALAANDLRGLLLGHLEYRYVPAGSPSPSDTDLSVLLGTLYDEVSAPPRKVLAEEYEHALKEALKSETGVGPVAYAIVFEALRRSRTHTPMNFALAEVAAELRHSIRLHSGYLARDFSGAGRGWPNGWLGELKRLSKLSQELGGPSFA